MIIKILKLKGCPACSAQAGFLKEKGAKLMEIEEGSPLFNFFAWQFRPEKFPFYIIEGKGCRAALKGEKIVFECRGEDGRSEKKLEEVLKD